MKSISPTPLHIKEGKETIFIFFNVDTFVWAQKEVHPIFQKHMGHRVEGIFSPLYAFVSLYVIVTGVGPNSQIGVYM